MQRRWRKEISKEKPTTTRSTRRSSGGGAAAVEKYGSPAGGFFSSSTRVLHSYDDGEVMKSVGVVNLRPERYVCEKRMRGGKGSVRSPMDFFIYIAGAPLKVI